jgi:hypothetical protein
MGDVFVGALGVFFLSYKHKPLPGDRLDNSLSYWLVKSGIFGILADPAPSGTSPATAEPDDASAVAPAVVPLAPQQAT